VSASTHTGSGPASRASPRALERGGQKSCVPEFNYLVFFFFVAFFFMVLFVLALLAFFAAFLTGIDTLLFGPPLPDKHPNLCGDPLFGAVIRGRL